MKNLISIVFMCLSLIGYSQDTTQESELSWPRDVQTASNKYEITLYQPQLESLKQNTLDGRMAVSIKDQNDDLLFGALWFTVKLDTDKSTRIAVFRDFQIPAVKFPDIEDETKLSKLKEVIIADLESAQVTMSLDRIIASLENVDTNESLDGQLNNEAPNIFFRNESTVLIYIDGTPILEPIEDSKMERVVNTPFFIIERKGKYYIKGGKFWYTSKELLSNSWEETTRVPSEVEKLANDQIDPADAPNEEEDITTPPNIIVVDTPSELIVTSGEPSFEPIKETSLLLVTNSENDVIMDINSQNYYVLLNGRWYNSKSTKDNSWNFVEPSDLPADFANVPSNADEFQAIRASIPGTEEAKEAVLEQYIPQTATIDRKTATVEVEYDGAPKFKKIEGTSMSYAENTSFSVLQVEGKYYCVESAVWYVADDPNGPWSVATERPEAVESIPPNNPVYNVKYVYIYDSTPEVVYVGYTPGYYHSYIYGGVVVYGTGFYYNPWYGRYYYPRPVTYGFGVHYNPYTGWGFSVGISYGWFSYSRYHHHHSYWGPAGYTHGYRHGYHRGYHHGYHNGYAAGYARGRYDSRNIYRTQNGVKRNTYDTGRRSTTQRTNLNNSSRRNNMYVDKNGDVHERNNKGEWEQKRNNSTAKRDDVKRRAEDSNVTRDDVKKRAENSNVTRDEVKNRAQNSNVSRDDVRNRAQQSQNTRATTNQRSSTQNRSQLERDYNSRNRGNQNYQKYQQNRTRSSTNTQRTRTTPTRSSGSRTMRRRG